MKPTKNHNTDGTKEPVQPLYHLTHATSKGRPLCGENSPSALIGSYVEHLDTTTPEHVQWIREVFGDDGKVVTPCPICLSIYPPALLDIVPFELNIKLQFSPNRSSSGYDVTADAVAEVEGKHNSINAFPRLGFFSAKWIGDLAFSIDVDANPIVPLVEHANKTKR